MLTYENEVYSAGEIARAAGVPLERVVAALGSADLLVGHPEAVRVGRALAATEWVEPRGGYVGALRPAASQPRSNTGSTTSTTPLFAAITTPATTGPGRGLPFAVSSTVHVGLVAAGVFLTSLSLAPTATVVFPVTTPDDELRLVYVATPGPGGGGGGGGRRQPMPAPKALRQGTRRISSPVPVRQPPPPVEPPPRPPEPTPPPPLNAEPLPVLVAPIVTAPADDRDRIGVLESSRAEAESHGPGSGGGAGTGAGTGLGSGDGSGVGPGSGGGTGGGPFRPGSGVAPPRLLREVKADYTEDARRRGIEGEVVLEIIVTRNGTVGDVKIRRPLGSGLDDRAVQAVRQWRFAPATLKGTPVDVVVEVAVEFKLR